MSRAPAIKHQSYFVSFPDQSRGRSTFGRLIFFPRPLSTLLPSSLPYIPLSLSYLVLFCCHLASSFLVIYIRFCGSMARADRNKVSIIPHLGPARRYGTLRTAAWRPGVFRLANMKSAAQAW